MRRDDLARLVEAVACPPGGSVRTDCPSCRGRGTFTMDRRDGRVVFACYRASCGFSGAGRLGRTLGEVREAISTGKPAAGTGKQAVSPGKPARPLPDHYPARPDDAFVVRWGLARAMQDGRVIIRRAPAENRVLFFPAGRPGRAVGRAIGDEKPRWLYYGEKGGVFAVPPALPARTGCIVLVEDVISAIRASDAGFPAVALLGVSISEEVRAYVAGKSVILALDPDASRRALKERRRLIGSADCAIVRLARDLKYEAVDAVPDLLGFPALLARTA